MTKRKFAISVITTSRADYGLLKWPSTAMRSDPDVDLKLIVDGSHSEDRHGNTIKEIRDDGFTVFATAPMYDGNSFSSTVKARQKFSRNNVTARRVAEGGDPMAYWEILSHVATKDYADGDPMFE